MRTCPYDSEEEIGMKKLYTLPGAAERPAARGRYPGKQSGGEQPVRPGGRHTVSILVTLRHNQMMRVISEKALREFWKVHPDAEQALRTWLTLANRAAWHTPDDIKRDFASASFLANNRVVFNIRGNN